MICERLFGKYFLKKGRQENQKKVHGLLQTIIPSTCLPVITLLYRTKLENDFQEKAHQEFLQ